MENEPNRREHDPAFISEEIGRMLNAGEIDLNPTDLYTTEEVAELLAERRASEEALARGETITVEELASELGVDLDRPEESN